jgi:hypothetical protein
MGKIRKITDLFDEQHEVAAWLVLATSIALLVTGRLDQWPFVALVATSLVTLLGSQYFRGVRVGPQGIEVRE